MFEQICSFWKRFEALEHLFLIKLCFIWQTNKELARKVVDALKTCLRGDGETLFISNEDDEVVVYDAADVIKKVIQVVVEKVKCSLNSIQGLIKDAELKKVFEDLKSAVEDILQNDLQKCAEAEGLKEKLT